MCLGMTKLAVISGLYETSVEIVNLDENTQVNLFNLFDLFLPIIMYSAQNMFLLKQLTLFNNAINCLI